MMMKSNDKNRWWNIFTDEKKSETDDGCPAVPVHAGRGWQKSLANVYCPCRFDAASHECHPVLI